MKVGDSIMQRLIGITFGSEIVFNNLLQGK